MATWSEWVQPARPAIHPARRAAASTSKAIERSAVTRHDRYAGQHEQRIEADDPTAIVILEVLGAECE